ncbi:MAG: hypothetical protein HYZ28_25220 [Myxococcales bacterium]|nr:hypothetical protein [Myxococcales bacterium]
MRILPILLAASLSGCVRIEVDRRIERGPLIRKYERPSVAPGGFSAEVRASWPVLEVALSTFDLCQRQLVEEYAEEIITERTAPSAGPAIALGTTTTLLGGGLLLARQLFSGEPNRSLIDGEGRYGASDRQVATGWAIGLLVAGLPALVVAALEVTQSGEDSELRRAEQVVGATEERCNPRPATAQVALAPGEGQAGSPTAPREARDGLARFTHEELRGQAHERVLADGVPAELAAEDMVRLDAFRSCAELAGFLTGEGAEKRVEEAPTDEVVRWLGEASACRAVEGAPAAEWTKSLEAELERRAPKDGGHQP